MTFGDIAPHLFALADKIARSEWDSGYTEIANVKGTFGWWFLEHASELLPDDQMVLLRGLTKRRFSMEGIHSSEVQLTVDEQAAVNLLLNHDNSLHGTRTTVLKAMSVLEEEQLIAQSRAGLSTKRAIRMACKTKLREADLPVEIVENDSEHLRWHAPIGKKLRLNGSLDFGGQDEQVSNFLVLSEGDRPLHAHTSLLGLLGIGTTSWSYLREGEEDLCASTVIKFYRSLYLFLLDVGVGS
jgi:hypothetical protein